MNIHITKGLGSGPTKLSAFDSALNDAGIANYNLLTLSSVIPPDSKMHMHDSGMPKGMLPGSWGDRLYLVMAEQRVDKPNVEAWAGIGWVQDKKTNKGLFVEHEGFSESAVRQDIQHSLEGLMATRNVDFGPIQTEVIGRTCKNHPVCAMVVALYQVADWDDNTYSL
ncbi:arginine decarboxylase, pyruvoyl-dependent [soil metagenome]